MLYISESDIQYISPSECLANAHAETNGSKNGDEAKDASKYHDPYQDIVSSHLAKAEQIKVSLFDLIYKSCADR